MSPPVVLAQSWPRSEARQGTQSRPCGLSCENWVCWPGGTGPGTAHSARSFHSRQPPHQQAPLLPAGAVTAQGCSFFFE